MIKKIVIFAILFFALGPDARAQLLNHKLGEFLVQFDKEVSPNEILPYLTDYQGNLVAFNLETIAADLNIHKVTIDYTITNEYEYLAALRNNNSILAAQFNHIAKKEIGYPMILDGIECGICEILVKKPSQPWMQILMPNSHGIFLRAD
ncbi:MAG: hypothetical protein IPQ18_02505 [Saprospiraceae bacterium]|nr:hypothetical protein [Saprospiraceae bacterium]